VLIETNKLWSAYIDALLGLRQTLQTPPPSMEAVFYSLFLGIMLETK